MDEEYSTRGFFLQRIGGIPGWLIPREEHRFVFNRGCVFFSYLFFLFSWLVLLYVRFFFSESVEFSEEILTPAGWLTCHG